jgi:DNA-binding NtrC family response regulator
VAEAVLGVDAAPGVAARLRELLSARGYAVRDLRAARDAVADDVFAGVVVEVPGAGGRGAARVRETRERDAGPAIVALCPPGMVEAAIHALKEGADDFVLGPFDIEELEIKLERALERRRERGELERLRGRLGPLRRLPALTGDSPQIRHVRRQIERVAPGRTTVLITGETGTGKELVAAAIHEASPRRTQAFIKVNCAALPETLLESELFGHERGAFTGADQRRLGRFEEAHRGTLFLDEIGDMHPHTQAKLLRVLQEQEFERLGGARPIKVDVRILAATNQNLAARIAEGSFREDLFFRLHVVSIEVPPLRERPADIPVLAERFLVETNAELPRPKRGFTAEAQAALVRHPWPGNVRELRNVVERAVLMGEGEWIGERDLALAALVTPDVRGAPALVSLPPEGIALAEVERAAIVAALDRCGWVQKDAARLLRLSRRKLNYRIARLGIRHASWRRNRPGGSARPRRPQEPGSHMC